MFWRSFRKRTLAIIGGTVIGLFLIVCVGAPVLAPHDPNSVDLENTLQPPGAHHLLGTDNDGRDVLSRILYGARLTLYVGVGSVGLGGSLGVLSGLLAGFYQRLNTPIMRMVDVLLAFPAIVVALTVVAILGPGTSNVILAVGISQLPQFARVVYSVVLTVREEAYIESARSIGAIDAAIIGRHIVPNILAPIIVQASLLMPDAILTAASLSFLGVGVKPPTPEWGAMLSDSRKWMQDAPYLMISPGVALLLVVLGFNLLGDGLRDAIDPRLRGT